MLFNSLTFLFLHFLFLPLYWSTKNQTVRLYVLLLSSVIFYGWYYWPGLFLLFAAMCINYLLSLLISKKQAKWTIALAVLLNLLNLGWFKYSIFIIANIESLINNMGFQLIIPKPDYWLPIGISFYTFQIMGYLIDVYRKEVPAEKSFLRFAVFKSFYAQLIAGPIVRSHELFPQLRKTAVFNLTRFQKGFFLMTAGLAIKICIADLLAQFVEYGFSNAGKIETLRAWLTLYSFSFQILSDFWGYSTVAVGIGLMYGISLPHNFNFPYTAQSSQDFWRRWHITLSEWFRDYLYIPLGGNKNRKYLNLILTMTIAGVWHGAGWNFLLWGFGHGIWLAIERVTQSHKIRNNSPLMRRIRIIVVFNIVSLLWIFFRAPDLNTAALFFKNLFAPPYVFNAPHIESLLLTLIIFILFNKKLGNLFYADHFSRLSLKRQLFVTIFLILFIMGYADARLDFIYFVF
ncbi:MAG: MBOAT family protein [Spirochaetia bacterium]|nr:MBOAT family protein [Spirochaetia bacterium]